MIPCERDKCLKYPACKQKETISCTELVRYINHNNPNLSHHDFWKLINEYLPNVTAFSIEGGI